MVHWKQDLTLLRQQNQNADQLGRFASARVLKSFPFKKLHFFLKGKYLCYACTGEQILGKENPLQKCSNGPKRQSSNPSPNPCAVQERTCVPWEGRTGPSPCPAKVRQDQKRGGRAEKPEQREGRSLRVLGELVARKHARLTGISGISR